MENTENTYLKTDDNKIINETHIRWVKKMSECLEVCTKSNGRNNFSKTHKICKSNNPHSYQKLNYFFDS
jgi:hypothetical protein